MAMKWHINKETDKPAECKATVKACPLGGAEVHYSSKAEAWKAIEQKHAADFVKGDRLAEQGQGLPGEVRH